MSSAAHSPSPSRLAPRPSPLAPRPSPLLTLQNPRAATSQLVADPKKRLGCLKNGPADIKNLAWFGGLDWKGMEEKKLKARHATPPRPRCSAPPPSHPPPPLLPARRHAPLSPPSPSSTSPRPCFAPCSSGLFTPPLRPLPPGAARAGDQIGDGRLELRRVRGRSHPAVLAEQLQEDRPQLHRVLRELGRQVRRGGGLHRPAPSPPALALLSALAPLCDGGGRRALRGARGEGAARRPGTTCGRPYIWGEGASRGVGPPLSCAGM